MPQPLGGTGAAFPRLTDKPHLYASLHPLTLHKVTDQVLGVLTQDGEHVGNLKLIGSIWKFKAIGYAADGGVIPGGGQLTDRHNTTFAAPDEALLNGRFSAEP